MIPIDNWQGELIRFTAFTFQGSSWQENNWWKELLKENPDSRAFIPKQEIQKESGQYKTGIVTIQSHPLRTDIIFQPNVAERKIEQSQVLNDLSYVKSLNTFIPIMNDWLKLESSPTTRRIAIASQVLFPVNERREGYNYVLKYLPNLNLDLENASDFVYQINRRRKSTSGIDKLEINRLVKFSVLKRVRYEIGGHTKGAPITGPFKYFFNIELDINTADEFEGSFSKDKTLALVEELVQLGNEIIEKGDIK